MSALSNGANAAEPRIRVLIAEDEENLGTILKRDRDNDDDDDGV